MNLKAINFMKNITYTISSNLISLFISTLVVLIIPRMLGVEEYGYWQLYIFYSSYVGFLHFGWNDGIYLRYGGEEYKNLNNKLFYSQFIELLITQILIGIIILIASYLLVVDSNRKFILQMIAIATVLVNTRFMLFYILQATNRIKEFARLVMLDRIIYILLITIFLMMGIRDFRLMILADLIGKFIALFFATILCKEIVFNRISTFYLTFYEIYENVNVGIKLMIANIASTLIIGIVKFGIERAYDVATFGKVSLTLSISNMMMIFINAVGIIIFPILRRTNPERLASIYSTMRDLLMGLLLGILIVYYPLKTMMTAWLPDYGQSLLYMALVFPMFIYEGKMALLINTYLKTLREEKVLLKINIISMFISIIMTYISLKVFSSLEFAIVNIVILLAFRSFLSEIYLAKKLNIKVKKDLLLETLLSLVFILTGWFLDSWVTVVIYGGTYFGYLLIKKKDISFSISNIKSLIKN